MSRSLEVLLLRRQGLIATVVLKTQDRLQLK